MSVNASFANIYVETIRDLIAANPKTLRAVDEFTTELVDDVVDALEVRMQELLDAYNGLADQRDALSEAVGSEEDAASELKEHEGELRTLVRAEKRRERDRAARAVERAEQRALDGLPVDADDEEDEEDEADALEQEADDRSQGYLNSSAIPEARGRLAAATRTREAAVVAVQESLEVLLQALLAFEER